MKVAWQLSKYGGISVGSALTDYAVFSALFFMGSDVMTAQMVARLSGGAFSFILNKYWCFDASSRAMIIQEGRRFVLLYTFSYILALTVLFILNEKLEVPVYLAKIAADVSCFVVNFIVMRSYVFSAGRGLRKTLWAMFKSS